MFVCKTNYYGNYLLSEQFARAPIFVVNLLSLLVISIFEE